MLLHNKYKRINGRFVIVDPILNNNKIDIRSTRIRSTKTAKTCEKVLDSVFIYGLYSPILNKYFYVGQTKDIQQRFKSHYVNKHDNITKNYHITLLKNKGLTFRMDILAEITVDLRHKWETGYITHLRQLGHPLTNRESLSEIEAKDIITEEYIETLIALDNEPVDRETLHNIDFLRNLY